MAETCFTGSNHYRAALLIMTSVEALLILRDTLEERCMKNHYGLDVKSKVLKRKSLKTREHTCTVNNTEI